MLDNNTGMKVKELIELLQKENPDNEIHTAWFQKDLSSLYWLFLASIYNSAILLIF